MSNALLQSMHRSIVLYVIKCEGKNYTGNHQFNLRYIQNSRYIPRHRKIDIERLNRYIIQFGTGDNIDADLALAIFTYLKYIQTGVKILWFQIGNASKLRDIIHNSVYVHDPDLYIACKSGSVEEYKLIRNNNTDVIIEIAGDVNAADNAVDAYVTLRNENVDLKNKLNREAEKNATLSDTLNRQAAVNDGLKKKIDRVINKNDMPCSEVQIEMANIGASLNNAPITSIPIGHRQPQRPGMAVR